MSQLIRKYGFVALLLSIAVASPMAAKASSVDFDSLNVDVGDAATSASADQINDMIVNRQPAILHPPVYEDESGDARLVPPDQLDGAAVSGDSSAE